MAAEPGLAGSGAGQEPALQSAGVVTVLEGATFCVSGRSGDIDPYGAQGLFFQDTRIISLWRLLAEGEPVQVLAVLPSAPYTGVFVSRIKPAGAETELLLERTRYVSEGMREDLRLRNLSREPASVVLTLDVGADFADVFAVKESRASGRSVEAAPDGSALVFRVQHGAVSRGVLIEAEGAVATPGRLTFRLEVQARSEWQGHVLVRPSIDSKEQSSIFPLGEPLESSSPARALSSWQSSTPKAILSDQSLQRTLRRSLDDLGSLRVTDPADPELVAVAAGAPWFMAVFGRDSLLASYMALSLEPSLAMGTLRTLARSQGRVVNPDSEEQPGRILHEIRLGSDFPLARGSGGVYYGTADATPLFVLLLGELSRWGIDTPTTRALLDHADRALTWIEQYGDRDGDGFVEYQRMTEHGLVNQGWKDSFDGITHADGTIAEPPVALCEVQAYVYAAYVCRSHFAHEAGDPAAAESWAAKARELKRAFNERFWLPEKGYFALGLDGRQAADRRAGLQHGALLVDRAGRRRARPRRRRTVDVA